MGPIHRDALAVDRANGNPLQIEIDHCIVGALRAAKRDRPDSPQHCGREQRHRSGLCRLDGIGRGWHSFGRQQHDHRGQCTPSCSSSPQTAFFSSRTLDDSAPVRSERRQTGCVRFSWMPLDCAGAAPLSLPAGPRDSATGGRRAIQKIRAPTPPATRIGGRSTAVVARLCPPLLVRAMAIRATSSCASPHRSKSAPGRTTKRRWAPFMIFFSRSARERPRAAPRISALRSKAGVFYST